MSAFRHDDLEAIRRLKHRYCLSVDLRDFDAVEPLLTADFTWESNPVEEQDKSYTWDRAYYFDFMRNKFPASMIAQHQVHHPEIDFTGPDAATGLWYNEGYNLNTETRTLTRGTALYHDRYRREGGVWKIAHMRYQRIFMIAEPLSPEAKIAIHYVGWKAARK